MSCLVLFMSYLWFRVDSNINHMDQTIANKRNFGLTFDPLAKYMELTTH